MPPAHWTHAAVGLFLLMLLHEDFYFCVIMTLEYHNNTAKNSYYHDCLYISITIYTILDHIAHISAFASESSFCIEHFCSYCLISVGAAMGGHHYHMKCYLMATILSLFYFKTKPVLISGPCANPISSTFGVTFLQLLETALDSSNLAQPVSLSSGDLPQRKRDWDQISSYQSE